MLRVLLAKDLRRAWRNPLPWVINLLVPLCITALIGLAFGGKSDGGALGRIRFAVVDEDHSPLSDFLRGAASQHEGSKYLEPVFLERPEAMRQIENNKLSAVLIIPEHFMRNYLTGREQVNLELIKNPAQSIHPAVLEELLGAVVTGLNAVARNFRSEFPDWQAVLEGKSDYHQVAALVERSGNKLKRVEQYINPPLVGYGQETATPQKSGSAAKSSPGFNLFAYLLAGMTAMFLLFLASNAMTDLHREVTLRTFERYHTLHESLLPFLAGKVLFTVVFLLLCSAVMLGGGALIFRIHWQQPLALVILTLAYAGFAAATMALLVALAAEERLANSLNTIAGMALGLAGGCAFPPQNLPGFLRVHITPHLPSYWFTNTVRDLEMGSANVPWGQTSMQLVGVSIALIAIAAFLYRRRFRKGIRP